MREKILPSEGRGMANEGGEREDRRVCVGGQKGEGDRRGGGGLGGAGGKRTRGQGG